MAREEKSLKFMLWLFDAFLYVRFWAVGSVAARKKGLRDKERKKLLRTAFLLSPEVEVEVNDQVITVKKGARETKERKMFSKTINLGASTKKTSPSKSIFRLGSVSLIDSLQVPLINLQRSAYNYVHGERRQKRGRKRNASENNDAIKNGNKSRARMHMKVFHLCDFCVQLAVRKVQLTLHLFDILAQKVSEKRSERRETRIRWKPKLWNEIIFGSLFAHTSHGGAQTCCTSSFPRFLKSLAAAEIFCAMQTSHRMKCLCKRKAGCAPRLLPATFSFTGPTEKKSFWEKFTVNRLNSPLENSEIIDKSQSEFTKSPAESKNFSRRPVDRKSLNFWCFFVLRITSQATEVDWKRLHCVTMDNTHARSSFRCLFRRRRNRKCSAQVHLSSTNVM